MDIGKRIKDKRKLKGLTLEELSAFVGVSRQTLSRYENGKIAVPSENIEKIAKALLTTPQYLMGWTADEYDYDADPEGRFDTIPSSILDGLKEAYGEDNQKIWGAYQAMNTDAFQESFRVNNIAAHALRDLTEEEAEELLKYAQYLKSRRKD